MEEINVLSTKLPPYDHASDIVFVGKGNSEILLMLNHCDIIDYTIKDSSAFIIVKKDVGYSKLAEKLNDVFFDVTLSCYNYLNMCNTVVLRDAVYLSTQITSVTAIIELGFSWRENNERN